MDTVSSSKKEFIVEGMIEKKTRFFSIGGKKLVGLPTFRMLKGLGFVYNLDHEVIVNRTQYESLELSGRPIYISEDSKDKRPFTYWGGATPINSNNRKEKLIDLIQPISEGQKIEYIDTNIYNLILGNINVVAIPLDDKRFNVNKKRLGSDFDPVKDILGIDTPPAQKEFDFTKPTEEVPINNLVDEQPTSPKITVDVPDDHRWYGTSRKKNKWSAVCKGKHLGTFETSLDAAKEYNKHVIKNGLPYPINNIPGLFDEYSIIKELELKDIDTCELATEIARRTNPNKNVD